MNVENVWELCLQHIETLITQSFINSTFFVEVSSTKQLVSIFQTSSVKSIRHNHTNDILRCDLGKLVVRCNFVLGGVCRRHAELLDLFSTLIPIE